MGLEFVAHGMEFVAHGLSAVLPHRTLLHHLRVLEPLLSVGVFQLERSSWVVFVTLFPLGEFLACLF